MPVLSLSRLRPPGSIVILKEPRPMLANAAIQQYMTILRKYLRCAYYIVTNTSPPPHQLVYDALTHLIRTHNTHKVKLVLLEAVSEYCTTNVTTSTPCVDTITTFHTKFRTLTNAILQRLKLADDALTNHGAVPHNGLLLTALKTFREIVIEPCSSYLFQAIFPDPTAFVAENVLSWEKAKRLTAMVSSLDGPSAYKKCVEIPFRGMLTTYYRRLADMFSSLPLREYLQQVFSMNTQVKEYVGMYLLPETSTAVDAVMMSVLLQPYVAAIVERSCQEVVHNSIAPESQYLWELTLRAVHYMSAESHVASVIHVHLRQEAASRLSRITDPDDDASITKKLEALHDLYLTAMRIASSSGHQISGACEHCLRSLGEQLISHFSNHVARLMCDGVRENNSHMTTIALDLAVHMCAQRDIYEDTLLLLLTRMFAAGWGTQLYRNACKGFALAFPTLLLSGTGTLVSKLYNLNRDLEHSINHLENPEGDVSRAIQVLACTQGTWIALNPKCTFSNCALPRHLHHLYEEYMSSYNRRHTGRKLSIQPSFGSVVVQDNLSGAILECSTVQASVLLHAFDNHNTVCTLDQLQSNTQFSDTELTAVLRTFVAVGIVAPFHQDDIEIRILPLSSNAVYTLPAPVLPTATVALSDSMSSPHQRRIEDDRRHAIKAHIVKYGKRVGTFTRQQVVESVVSALAGCFVAKVEMVCECLSALAKKEFFEECSEVPGLFRYVP